MSVYGKPLGESEIEWASAVWNPSTGCSKVSAGCKFCYAEPLAERLQRMGNAKYARGFEVALHPHTITDPVTWRDSQWVFVNSMSDLLHAEIDDAFILDVFETMAVRAPWHRYQVLTKRPERWASITEQVRARFGSWPRNVLPGTSIEDVKALARLLHLSKAGDAQTIRMVSVEPLLESLMGGFDGDIMEFAARLSATGIGWVITGGESGRKARPCEIDWFREVRDACGLAGTPYFHKQHGGVGMTKATKRGGLLAQLDGVLHHAMPEVWAAPAPRLTRTSKAALLHVPLPPADG